MRRLIRGRAGQQRTGQSGQALLELALVAPVIILLLMGLIQFALIYERQVGITNAVREAARRAAAIDVADSAAAQANATWALSELQTLLGNSQTHESSRDNIEVCIATPTANATDVAGNQQVMVRVTDSYKHPLWLPIVTQILDGIDGSTDQSLLASTVSEFRVEQTTSVNVSGQYARFNGTTTTTGTPCTT
jgi:Flp pilus assembly protein TadG